MKLVFLLSALAVACSAQEPARPVISETFQAVYDIERHTDATIFGKGMMARSTANMSAVENSTYDNGDMEFRLERYDLKMEYSMRRLCMHAAPKCQGFADFSDKDRCAFRKTSLPFLPSFWGFLEIAKYVGEQVVRHVTYDIWEFNSAGVRISLAVGKSDPNSPVILERETAQSLVIHTFSNFQTDVPSNKVFAVPKSCQQPGL